MFWLVGYFADIHSLRNKGSKGFFIKGLRFYPEPLTSLEALLIKKKKKKRSKRRKKLENGYLKIITLKYINVYHFLRPTFQIDMLELGQVQVF